MAPHAPSYIIMTQGRAVRLPCSNLSVPRTKRYSYKYDPTWLSLGRRLICTTIVLIWHLCHTKSRAWAQVLYTSFVQKDNFHFIVIPYKASVNTEIRSPAVALSHPFLYHPFEKKSNAYILESLSSVHRYLVFRSTLHITYHSTAPRQHRMNLWSASELNS